MFWFLLPQLWPWQVKEVISELCWQTSQRFPVFSSLLDMNFPRTVCTAKALTSFSYRHLTHDMTQRVSFMLQIYTWSWGITSGNQASCSMRLQRKQLCCTLPSLFFLRLPFCCVFCRSIFWGQFAPKIHDETERLQEKLQQCKLVRLSSIQAGWQCHLQLNL